MNWRLSAYISKHFHKSFLSRSCFCQRENFDCAFKIFHESKYINCWKQNRTTWTPYEQMFSSRDKRIYENFIRYGVWWMVRLVFVSVGVCGEFPQNFLFHMKAIVQTCGVPFQFTLFPLPFDPHRSTHVYF